ncbi:MAG: Efflux transporter, RND family, MFP subunit [uncultured bacterium]|nr:MAG: Efflux transporter, RND family, MFP subunit [uncultured bacterium]
MAISLSFSESTCQAPTQPKGPPVPKAMDPVAEVDVIPPRFLNKPRTVSGFGTFEASDHLIVKAPQRGVIQKVQYNEGDQVKIDDTLCTFRGDEINNQINAKQTEIKAAQTELDSLKNMLQGFRNSQAGEPSPNNTPPPEPLFLDEEAPSHVVPPKPMGIVNPEPVQNQAELETKIHTLEAKLETLTKELASLEESLKGLTIRATIQGMIRKRNVTDGAIVESGDALFEIVTLNPITLTFFVPQDVTSYVDKDIKVTGNPTSAPELKTDGLVYYVSPAIDPVKRMLELKAHLPNDKGLIREGQEGQATVVTRRVDQVWVIPKKSIVTFEGKNYIYVQTGNQARKTEVVLGEPTGNEEVIADANLRIDDLILTTGLDSVKDGSFIKITQSLGQK